MPSRKLHIALLMGGPSAEHEVSLDTGRVILKNLDKKKYWITPVVITKLGKWKLFGERAVSVGTAIDTLKQKKVDIVFIAMHGTFGEDGTIQGLLEFVDIPYTGSGVLASALAIDKAHSYELFKSVGLRVPRHRVVLKKDWQKAKRSIKLPCVIKPTRLGSSVGISIVKKRNELEQAFKNAFSHTDEVLVDEYIQGREVTCGVLDDGQGKIRVLPPTEIIPKSGTFFDYTAKYVKGASDEITPARFPKAKIRKIQEIAKKAHIVLGCAGMSRTDMIVRGNTIYVLETNTIPGMTETSLLPQAAKSAGISFPRLLDLIIAAGL